jgi:hypothetical protein
VSKTDLEDDCKQDGIVKEEEEVKEEPRMVVQSVSVSDYFAAKMAQLKKKPIESHLVESQPMESKESEESDVKEKKEKKRKSKHQGSDTRKVKEKKSKKAKKEKKSKKQ